MMDVKGKIKNVVSKSESKAWAYFKQVLNDDEKFVMFKEKKKRIGINGNNGGIYFLYPNGQIVRLDDDRPMMGNIYFNNTIHKVDFLTTVLMWIKHNEKELKRVWGCGSLSMLYNGHRRMREPTAHLNRRPMHEETPITLNYWNNWHPYSGLWMDAENNTLTIGSFTAMMMGS